MTRSDPEQDFMSPLEDQAPDDMRRGSKLITADEAGEIIAAQETISIAGSHSADGALTLIRAAIRAGAEGMTMIPPVSTSIAADLPIAAGMLEKLYVSYIGFEYLGLAPAFREAAEAGTLDIVEADEPFIILGTKAAAGGRPFAAVRHLYEATDHPKLNPELATVVDPFSGEEVYAIPALESDVFVMHAQASDPYGNAQVWGGTGQERNKAKAADLVIVQADEIVGSDVITEDPTDTTVPGLWVDHVVHAPYGAHPTFSSGKYAVDEAHLREYGDQVTDGRAAEYIEEYVHGPADHEEYVERVGGVGRMAELRHMLAEPQVTDAGGGDR